MHHEHLLSRPALRRLPAIGLALVASAIVAAASAPAHAQDAQPPAPAPSGAPPPPVYQTPLRQETQDSYVPQSVAMSGPTEITDWQEGQPVPSGYHPVQRVRKGFIIAGAVTLGTMYLLTAFGAAIAHDANQNGSADALFIPVAGPFLQMSQTSYTTGQFLNIVDGLAQTGGLVMLVYGLSSPSTILIRNDVGVRTLLPVPYANSQGAGMGFVGTF